MIESNMNLVFVKFIIKLLNTKKPYCNIVVSAFRRHNLKECFIDIGT